MRVSVLSLQQTLISSVQTNLAETARLQQQLASGKKVNDFSDLAGDTVRTVSASAVAKRERAYAAATDRASATLAHYDASLGGLHDSAQSLRQTLLTALGTGNGSAIAPELEAAFGQIGSALNVTEAGIPLFAGGATGQAPFKPHSLADLASLSTADVAFGDDGRNASAPIGDGRSITIGIGASQVGTDIVDSLRTLAAAAIGPGKLNAADRTAIEKSLTLLESGLSSLAQMRANNGRKQADLDTVKQAALDRSDMLTNLVGQVEDANYAELSTKLMAAQSALQASYSVFAQLKNLTLANYLR